MIHEQVAFAQNTCLGSRVAEISLTQALLTLMIMEECACLVQMLLPLALALLLSGLCVCQEIMHWCYHVPVLPCSHCWCSEVPVGVCCWTEGLWCLFACWQLVNTSLMSRLSCLQLETQLWDRKKISFSISCLQLPKAKGACLPPFSRLLVPGDLLTARYSQP